MTALQRLDLSKLAYTIASLIQYIGQIIALIVFRSYYGFVIFFILGTVGKNVLSAYLADRYFPQYKSEGIISVAVRRDIISRVKGIFICNVAGLAHTIDSIILSSFIGLKAVAIYNNYILIYTGVGTFIAMLRAAMQASVGNSVAIESKSKNYGDMLLWQFLFSFIATWCCTCMFVLYQPFMKIWMGSDMLLPDHDVVVICVWFFLGIIQHSYFLYLAGTGSWWELRWVYSVGGLMNLILNIVLGRIWGISGIIFASLLSAIISGLIWQCSIIFRIYFHRSTGQFYRRLAAYGGVCVVCCLLSAILADNAVSAIFNVNVFKNGIFDLLIRSIICTLVAVGLQLFLYSRLSFTKKELARAQGFIITKRMTQK